MGDHSVGVANAGPGLPILGWSTTGGDLRPAHFVGLHAMQVLPFVGWLVLQLRGRRWRDGHRLALVWTTGLLYLGLMLVLFVQGLRGQSIIAPDALTLAGFGAVILGGLASGTAISVHALTKRPLLLQTGSPPVSGH